MNDRTYNNRLQALNEKYPSRGRGVNRNIPELDRCEALALHAAAKEKPGRRVSDLPFGCTALSKWQKMRRTSLLKSNEQAIALDRITAAQMNRQECNPPANLNFDVFDAHGRRRDEPKPSPRTIEVRLPSGLEVTGLTFSQLKRLIRSQESTS